MAKKRSHKYSNLGIAAVRARDRQRSHHLLRPRSGKHSQYFLITMKCVMQSYLLSKALILFCRLLVFAVKTTNFSCHWVCTMVNKKTMNYLRVLTQLILNSSAREICKNWKASPDMKPVVCSNTSAVIISNN